jgi:hypothetical protein
MLGARRTTPCVGLDGYRFYVSSALLRGRKTAAGSVNLYALLSSLRCEQSTRSGLTNFNYGEALLVESYQNRVRQHLALCHFLVSLIPLRSVICWVINERSVDSVANNQSNLFHETNS